MAKVKEVLGGNTLAQMLVMNILQDTLTAEVFQAKICENCPKAEECAKVKECLIDDFQSYDILMNLDAETFPVFSKVTTYDN